jgi:hypothetical protein
MSEHSHLPRDGSHDEQESELTRRTVLAGVAATTLATGVVGVEIPARAQASVAIKPEDMLAFIYLSSALTGIAGVKLAPGFAAAPPQPQSADPLKKNQGSDPVGIKHAYFKWIVDHDKPRTFPTLLQIARDSLGAPDRDAAIIQKVQASDDTKYLARSIVLMWYLGAWYAPQDLQRSNRNPGAELNFNVISPEAYTQGWALSVAQAHPMGFSRFQFGYWSHPPRDLGDFIG